MTLDLEKNTLKEQLVRQKQDNDTEREAMKKSYEDQIKILDD